MVVPVPSYRPGLATSEFRHCSTTHAWFQQHLNMGFRVEGSRGFGLKGLGFRGLRAQGLGFWNHESKGGNVTSSLADVRNTTNSIT